MQVYHRRRRERGPVRSLQGSPGCVHTGMAPAGAPWIGSRDVLSPIKVSDCRRRARLVRLRKVAEQRTVGVVSGPSGGKNSMSTIESVSHEHRVFEPPAHFVAQANVKKAD